MSTRRTHAEVLAASEPFTRLQGGPLPGVEPIADSPETIQRLLELSERAAFDLAFALACTEEEPK